jgi:DNA-binding beta-propeller fold protein YncE
VAISSASVVFVTQLDAGFVARTSVPSKTFDITFAIGAIPSQVRISPDGQTAYVNNQDAGSVKFVNVSSNTPFKTVTVPGSVLTIGLALDGTRLYALTDYRGVYVIDARSGAVQDSIGVAIVGSILTGVAFHPSAARMYVAARDAGTVATINTQTNAVMQVTSVAGGNLQNVAVSRDGDELFATDIQRSKLIAWDLVSGSLASTHQEYPVGTPVPRNTFDVVVTRDNAQVYVSTLVDGKVYVLDRVTRTPIDSIRTGGSARYIGFDGLGGTAVIPNEGGWVTFVH